MYKISTVSVQSWLEGLKKAKNPTDDWGPVELENRTGRYALHPHSAVFTVSSGKDNQAFQMETQK